MLSNTKKDESKKLISAKNSPSSQVIDISSDSEDDIFCQVSPRKENKNHDSSSVWGKDVIELTGSDSSNSSDLPDMLSPLVKGSRIKESATSRRPHSEKFIPLYADTSNDEESDEGCILVLNDLPSSRRPIRRTHPTKGQDVAEGIPPEDFSKKNISVIGIAQGARKSPSKRQGRSSHKASVQVQRQQYAAELFAELNENVFADRLPKDTTLEWNKRLLTTAGRARWHRSRDGVHTTKIELASKILDSNERIRNTLSHEMCHLACWVIDNHPQEGHGHLFKSWANKVMRKHPEIHISTRHNYEISYPYEWRCEKCSKTYGRYSKSIRPDECVCGACKAGKLIPLFVEKKRMTPKISRMAVARSRECPYSLIQVDSSTKNVPVMREISTDPDEDIPALVNTLKDVSINSTKDQ